MLVKVKSDGIVVVAEFLDVGTWGGGRWWLSPCWDGVLSRPWKVAFPLRSRSLSGPNVRRIARRFIVWLQRPACGTAGDVYAAAIRFLDGQCRELSRKNKR